MRLRVLRVARGATRLMWRSSPQLCGAFVATQLVAAAITVAVLWQVRDILQALTQPGRAAAAVPHVWLVGLLLAVAAVLVGVQRHVMTVLAERVGMHAMERVLAVSCGADLVQFDSPEFHGRLRRAQEAGQRPVQFAESLLGMGQALSTVCAVGLALWAIDPLLIAIVLVAALPMFLSTTWLSRTVFDWAVAMMNNDLRRFYLREVMTSRDAAKEVRAFGMAEHLMSMHRRLFAERLRQLTAVLRRTTLFAALGRLGSSLGLSAAGIFLVSSVNDGRLTIAAAGTAVAALLQLNPLLTALSVQSTQLVENALFLDDYERFVAAETALVRQGRVSGTPAPGAFDRIVVDDVSFRYPDAARPALDGVSMTIGRGQVVALVGENGSGKTTLSKILCGLYAPAAGAVSWDGVDIATMDPASLRSRIAVAFQDFGRYQFSVADNISLGTDPDDRARIETAGRRAGADEFVRRLPDGYDTPLGRRLDDGVDLSGGQWQRIAIARAFHRDAPLVILDEPTASLDAMAEHELFDTIQTLFAGRSVLLVSHRFSTVRSADVIYVMSEGRIVESGSHPALMERDGVYARMFRLQADAYLSTGREDRAAASPSADRDGAPSRSMR
jgi:ATP-binding cassette subfamily B protein